MDADAEAAAAAAFRGVERWWGVGGPTTTQLAQAGRGVHEGKGTNERQACVLKLPAAGKDERGIL